MYGTPPRPLQEWTEEDVVRFLNEENLNHPVWTDDDVVRLLNEENVNASAPTKPRDWDRVVEVAGNLEEDSYPVGYRAVGFPTDEQLAKVAAVQI